jgi:hypothetical protein
MLGKPEERIKITITWPIDSRGTKNDDWKTVVERCGDPLSGKLAPPIRSDRVTRIALLHWCPIL